MLTSYVEDDRPIYPSSPRMLGDFEARRVGQKLVPRQFPFSKLECGQSFAVQFDEINENSLRNMATRKSTGTPKQFRVVKHNDCYEVGRVK